MMILFCELISVVFSAVVLLKLIRITKKGFHCILPVAVIFDLTMVIPIFLEILYGIPNIPYKNFVYALEDVQTTYIYLFFIILFQISFMLEIRRIRRIKTDFKIRININDYIDKLAHSKAANYIRLFSFGMLVIAMLAILFSPNISYYLRINTVHYVMSPAERSYQNSVMKPMSEVLLACVLLLKIIDYKDKKTWFYIRALFAILICFISQKRTMLLIIVGGCIVIDLAREKKIKELLSRYIIVVGLTAFYFYKYMIITDKISYNSDWYYEMNEYIFRSMHMRFAIYATLHPGAIHILDYPGQSILFSLLFFVPRSIWAGKPYPYINYYISGVMGFDNMQNIGWHMPVGYIPEFVSNFGLIGIFVAMLFTIWICRYFDRRKPPCKILGIALISLIEIYYYDNLLKIVAAVVLLMCIKEKVYF